MVRKQKRETIVALGVAAAYSVAAGGVALSVILRRKAASEGAHQAHPDAEIPAPLLPDHEEVAKDPDPPHWEPGPEDASVSGAADNSSWRERAKAYALRGSTATFAVLLLLAAGTGIWAWFLHPRDTPPEPGSVSIDLTFAPGHPATHAINVTLWLMQTDPAENGGHAGMDLDIDIASPDLAQPGWTVLAFAPVGVQSSVDPRTGRVTSKLAAGGASIYDEPGPRPTGTYGLSLSWENLSSGPLQTQGADMTARFPELTVENQASPGSSTYPPQPQLVVTQELQPGGDYAYVDGPPPDHQNLYTWTWDPGQGTSGGATPYTPAMTVGAQSPSVEAQSHDSEFQSGILFGVAAGALTAAIQEFMTSARRQRETAE